MPPSLPATSKSALSLQLETLYALQKHSGPPPSAQAARHLLSLGLCVHGICFPHFVSCFRGLFPLEHVSAPHPLLWLIFQSYDQGSHLGCRGSLDAMLPCCRAHGRVSLQGHSGNPDEVFIGVGPVEAVQQQVLEEVPGESPRDDNPLGAVAEGHPQHRR